MENTEKVEIGYTVPKERWQEAAKNLEELGNVLAAGFLKQNKDGRGKEDADDIRPRREPVAAGRHGHGGRRQARHRDRADVRGGGRHQGGSIDRIGHRDVRRAGR